MIIGFFIVIIDIISLLDNQRRNVDIVFFENFDFLYNKILQNISMLILFRFGFLDMFGSSFIVLLFVVSVSEKRMRQKVGRNLLGVAQLASFLILRYDCEWNNLELCFMF